MKLLKLIVIILVTATGMTLSGCFGNSDDVIDKTANVLASGSGEVWEFHPEETYPYSYWIVPVDTNLDGKSDIRAICYVRKGLGRGIFEKEVRGIKEIPVLVHYKSNTKTWYVESSPPVSITTHLSNVESEYQPTPAPESDVDAIPDDFD